jgi:glycogen synthase
MPGAWPEPFGLVAIESLACGTPVVARRVGGLPEIIREGIDGYFGDDPAQLAFQLERVGDLDRTAIRASVVNRFSASRMADGYEALYRRLVADHRREPRRPEPAMTDGLPSLQPIGGGTRRLVRGGGGDGTDGELAIS